MLGERASTMEMNTKSGGSGGVWPPDSSSRFLLFDWADVSAAGEEFN